MRYSKLTYHLLITFISLIYFSGCGENNDLFIDTHPQKEKSMIQATLLLSLKDLDIHTRANSYFLAGTEEENRIQKLTIFIVDASEVKDYSFIANIPDDKKIFINVTTSEGIKTIFVGANMTTEQIDAVKNAPDKNPEQSLNEISKIATNNNFLMTGQAVSNDGSKEIQIVADETIPINVSLNRVVSKVLLTCSTDNVDGVEYISLPEKNGYIRLSDIHYVLSTTNKKFYPFAKANNEDPNYGITKTISESFESNFFTSPETVMAGAPALKFDATRIKKEVGRYTEGIYCLENTIDLEGNTYSGDLSIPKKVGTYLKIAAKFTPKQINNITVLSESEAQQKLANGTFYVCKKASENIKKICYSSIDAGKEFLKGYGITELTDEDFIVYEGGWQYYETFINSPKDFSENSGLLRNNYYIVHIKSFTAPIQEKTIEVNTIVASWSIKGITHIDIETGN